MMPLLRHPNLSALMGAAGLVLLTAPLASCVLRTEHKIETVHKIDAHIVLDVRQIKQDAAAVEDYVRGEGTQPPALDGNGEPVSWAMEPRTVEVASLDLTGLLAGPVLVAQAEQGSSEAERKAIADRKARAATIAKHLKAGVLGEGELGYVEVLIDKNVKDDARRKLRGELVELTTAENRDRRVIYLAVARRQNLDERSLPAIERIFAEQIRDRLEEGEMFQAPKDAKFFKDFQQTPLGKLYPGAKPGEWLKKKKVAG